MKSLLWLALLLTIALPAAGATAFERMVFRELNAARTDPAAFAVHLQRYRELFVGSVYHPPGVDFVVTTEEGLAAVDEAIAFLRRQRPLPPLQWAEGLARSGAELVRAQAASGRTGHGRGKLGMEARIVRQGEWTGIFGENISYGPFGPDGGRDVILQLIVDDGVAGRGHRLNIFQPAYRLAGVACGSHPTLTVVCVIDFAGGQR
jgi:uncharacterized protein YkwD